MARGPVIAGVDAVLRAVSARTCAWFLDVDGTLLDIARAPSEVRVRPAVRAALAALHNGGRGALALVSGRTISDVDSILHLPSMPVVGVHGGEVRAPSGDITRAALDAPALAHARRALTDLAMQYPGVLLEDKGIGCALHFRNAPVVGEQLAWRVRALAAELAPALTMQHGKHVVELRAAGHDKGTAVRHMMVVPPFAGRTPVMIGDDATDEDAFDAVNAMRGVSVKVGEGMTRAHFRLANPSAVAQLLTLVTSSDGTHDEQAAAR